MHKMLGKKFQNIFSQMVVFHGDESHGRIRKKITNKNKSKRIKEYPTIMSYSAKGPSDQDQLYDDLFGRLDKVTTGVMKYYELKQCTVLREIFQIYHTFATCLITPKKLVF